VGKSDDVTEGFSNGKQKVTLTTAFHHIRAAYGYTDEYILTKTVDWITDALCKITDSKVEDWELEAALHGAKLRKSGVKEKKEDASHEDLKKVGIKFG